ncbi:hypothetical protein MLPF_1780 [Mycobacterium lepromatosis]|nr:hypothetical protein MLPF_1780 [Mycobacterium lepromatosis]
MVYIWRALPHRSRIYRGMLLVEQSRTALSVATVRKSIAVGSAKVYEQGQRRMPMRQLPKSP